MAYDFSRQALASAEGKPVIRSRFGPALELSAAPLAEETKGKGMRFAGLEEPHHLAATTAELRKLLPSSEFTAAAWFSIDSPQEYGAVFSALEDRGGAEKGMALDPATLVTLAIGTYSLVHRLCLFLLPI